MKFLKNQVNQVFLTHALNNFAFSLFSIFIPIYLYTIGYSVKQIFGFILVQFITVMFVSFLIGYLAKHIGLKNLILSRIPFVIVQLMLLTKMPDVHVSLWLVALLGGIHITVYWIPLHSVFSRVVESKGLGRNTGRLQSFPQFAAVLSPLIGGFIITFFSYEILFLVGIVALFISSIPIFFSKEIKPMVNFTLHGSIKLIKENWRFFVASTGISVGALITMSFWPLYIFLIIGSELAAGTAGTLWALGAGVFTLVVGGLVDKFGEKKILNYAIFITGAWWILRGFSTNPLFLMVVTLIGGFFGALIGVPYESLSYKTFKKGNIDEMIILREIFFLLGRLFIIGLAFLVIPHYWVLFTVAGLMYLLILFVRN